MLWMLGISVMFVLTQALAAAARGAPDSFADLAESISPAVVNITTTTTVAGRTGPQGIVPEFTGPCRCRKPAPGLLELAVARHDIDLSRSCAIGDSPRDLFPDVEGLGARILVLSGHPPADTSTADHVAPDIASAVDWWLARAAPQAPADDVTARGA